MNKSIKTALAALIEAHATLDFVVVATIRLDDNSFEEACFDQLSVDQLIYALQLDSTAAGSFTNEELADEIDCAEWGIDADKWVRSVERALVAKSLFENQ